MVGECRYHAIAAVLDPIFGLSRSGIAVEMFDGEKFVSLESAEAIDVHNKVLRDIYHRLDTLESKVK